MRFKLKQHLHPEVASMLRDVLFLMLLLSALFWLYAPKENEKEARSKATFVYSQF
jgi:hypothetical protein